MFFIIFAVLYGLLNAYVYYSATQAFPSLSVFFATGILLLYASLFLAVLLERKQKIKLSLPFSWIGYTWFGVGGLTVTLFALGDLGQVLTADAYNDRIQFIVTSSTVALISIWGAVEAQRYRIRSITIESAKLPAPHKPLRVVQISDLHLGDSSSLRFVARLVKDINALKPDIVVSTGDLFDGYLELMAPYVDLLREIQAPLGKFAVSGNHEAYAGLEKALSLTELAGFVVLRNRSVNLPQNICIAGVEDPACPNQPDEDKTLPPPDSQVFTLLLKHRPAFNERSKARFNLQLSGHTHGGQIAPFHLLTKIQYRLGPGLHQLSDQQQLYVSRGTGAWGPQIRFLAPPEISVFDLQGR